MCVAPRCRSSPTWCIIPSTKLPAPSLSPLSIAPDRNLWVNKLLKMKIAITLILIFLFNRSFAQDTIYWQPNYKLKWQDFQGIPDSSSKDGAISYPVIRYHLSANEDSFNVKVICFFIRSKSWSKFKKNDTLLMHEQGHFDIAELFARKLRKTFSEYKFNRQTVGKDIDKIFLLNRQQRTETDMLYDKETNHSQNTRQQVLWIKKIKTELDSLKDFAST